MKYIKHQNDDVPKHKKKSNKKGLSRSSHKHVYETVLLRVTWHGTDFKTGKPKDAEILTPTKVCQICGYRGHVDYDEALYVKELTPENTCFYKVRLSEKALSLPKWYCDAFDKFARKERE